VLPEARNEISPIVLQNFPFFFKSKDFLKSYICTITICKAYGVKKHILIISKTKTILLSNTKDQKNRGLKISPNGEFPQLW